MVSGMQAMAMGPPPGDTKIVKCENCGADVTVNAAYPIESVKTCPQCPAAPPASHERPPKK